MIIAAAWQSHIWEWLREHWSEVWLALLFAILVPFFGGEYIVKVFREFARKHWGLFEKKIKRDPDDIPAESLVDGHIEKASARDLIKAINLGALRLVARVNSPTLLGLSPIADAWRKTSFNEYANIEASFISPRCTVAAVNGRAPMGKNDALAVLKEWLQGPLRTLHGEIRGDAGIGKTVLLHQLFLDLAKPSDRTVPMLASANNINQNSDELERLKEAGNHVSAFVTIWLKRRRVVAKTVRAQEAMVRTMGTALESGEILLLLDGVDELKQKGATDFVDGLLDRTKRWIVTQRYETFTRQESTGNIITLEPWWSRERVLDYTRRRLASVPDLSLRVESVLSQIIPEKGTSSHWLSHPSNLRAYIDEVESASPTITESELYHLAESATGLMEKLVERDMRRIDGADPVAIRDALSTLALCKPGDPRALRDGPLGKIVGGLKTLLRRDGNSLVFRHAAEAEYFLALRLAAELLEPPSNLKDAEGLQTVASHPWGTARVRMVDEALRSMAPGADDRATRIADWLRGSSPASLNGLLGGNGKRNILEVWKVTRCEDAACVNPGTMQGMDLNQMDGQGLDLKNERIENCTFVHADLRDAEMMHAQFIGCDFASANFTRASAIGAHFQGCSFGEGDRFARVKEFEIEGIAIIPPELETELIKKGASSQRSRYRGKFGEQFLLTQKAFLGRAAEDLETKSYLPAIQRAIARSSRERPGQALYMLDLMAGGRGGRSEELLAHFPLLHVLSIDRDAPQRTFTERHQWMLFEFGGAVLSKQPDETDPFGLRTLLQQGFPECDGSADLVIAKKAFHELEPDAQAALMQSCAAVLRPGGHLVIFVDAPGPETGPIDRTRREKAVQCHEQLRKLLLDRTTQPHDVKELINADRYRPDPIGEWLFVNDWVAIKDWANLNWHELAHRYFASIAELRQWASPWFGETVEVTTDWYDINPLRFNERGVNWVLHFLERHNEDREGAIAQHRAKLADQLAGSEAFRSLVEITRSVLERPTAFTKMMHSTQARVELSNLDPVLAALERPEVAPQFKLKCGVLTFERGRDAVADNATAPP